MSAARLRVAGIGGVLALAVAGVAGCGGAGTSPLEQTADHLSDIHSGTLQLELSLTPQGSAKGVGVKLDGPFSLAGNTPLPVARITYTQHADSTVRAVFTSTGTRAFVTTGGRTTLLTDQQTARLRLGAGKTQSLDDLGLHVERWVKAAKTADGPSVDGRSTQRITGALDAPAALGDLAKASGGASGLSSEDAKRLANTVSRSSVEVLTGKDDHLLRRLAVSADLAVPPELRAKVGGRVGLRVVFRMSIAHPNQKVRVSAPAGS